MVFPAQWDIIRVERRFETFDLVEETCQECFNSKPKKWYFEQMRKLADRWQNIMDNARNLITLMAQTLNSVVEHFYYFWLRNLVFAIVTELTRRPNVIECFAFSTALIAETEVLRRFNSRRNQLTDTCNVLLVCSEQTSLDFLDFPAHCVTANVLEPIEHS
ncbi:hypothetical protein KIN20_037574 [Parelaphostrongylus tenuis]|uniref:Uncharacterized protein n=1 Tax=Parelaphostrongylus tenuis TaxID=148309 RepID=A0AAD5REF9_PARTN|nr:hypothetical protein KIN20_037574 [Parelaphostrongylus tenuis]